MNYPLPPSIAMFQTWLQKKSERIQNMQDMQPLQGYNSANWTNRFSDSALAFVLGKHPEALNRLEVAAFAKDAAQAGFQEDTIRRFFWAVMLWGWATAGNGPERVSRIFKAGDPFPLITDAFRLIYAGNVGAAYNSLRTTTAPTIKHLDEAYFSKLLYFAGLGCNLKLYPLILDSKVVATLNAILGSGAPKPRRQQDYLRYVAMMHEWATTLECRADSIEYLLFLMPSEFWI